MKELKALSAYPGKDEQTDWPEFQRPSGLEKCILKRCLIFVLMYACYVYVDTFGGHRWASDPPEMLLQEVVSHHPCGLW